MYSNRLKKSTRKATYDVDKILHRNRSILLELLLTNKKREVNKQILEEKGFKFNYCTGVYYNTQNKLCFYVYDFLWYELRDKRVFISKIQLPR